MNPSSRQFWLYAAGLVVITLVAYSRVWSFEYLHYDDTLYVTKNPFVLSGLHWDNVVWAFTTFEVANWQPLTWISHMADVSLFGQSARGPHGVNLALHIANTVLLFWVFSRMTGAVGRSALVAALFAVHPLHVESVAWIAERKDVLSSFFGLLALCAYALYSAKRTPLRYGLVAVFFACSLMAKAMWVTLPFVLLLLDVWPLQRFGPAKKGEAELGKRIRLAVLEKLPLLALSIGSSIATIVAQGQSGAVASTEMAPMFYRIANAIDAYTQYTILFFVPHGMAAFYPHPGMLISMGAVAFGFVLLSALTLGAMRMWKKQPYAVIGWFWFLGTLVPVIGIVQVGSQAYADRYTYLPSIGLSVAVVWGAYELLRNLKPPPALLVGASIAVVLVGAALTWVQSGYWENDEKLWRHALAVTENNYRAHANLGHALTRNGEHEEAVTHLVRAAELYPTNPRTYVGLGNALEDLGRLDAAENAYQRALEVDVTHANAYVNLGALKVKRGDLAHGPALIRRGLELDPRNAEGHNNLGAAFAMRGQFDRAIEHFQTALRLRPGYDSAQANLERALQHQRGGLVNR